MGGRVVGGERGGRLAGGIATTAFGRHRGRNLEGFVAHREAASPMRGPRFSGAAAAMAGQEALREAA